MAKNVFEVLLVEDDPDDYYLIKDLIEDIDNCCYKIKWIDRYDQALECVINSAPDLCLLDYNLGEKSGLSLLEKAIELEIATPFVLLTGLGDQSIDQIAMSMGAADYLPKAELSVSLLERVMRHAIERAKLLKALKDKAQIDALTGIYNRGYIDQRLKELIESSRRHQFELTLVLCDLDHFKHINDKYGHQAGDKALQDFAEILCRNVRSEDLVGRYGGDEFIIAFPYVSAKDATACIDRMLNDLKKHSVNLSEEIKFSIKSSFGLTSLRSGLDLKDMIRFADQALYQAKSSGRCRLEVL